MMLFMPRGSSICRAGDHPGFASLSVSQRAESAVTKYCILTGVRGLAAAELHTGQRGVRPGRARASPLEKADNAVATLS